MPSFGPARDLLGQSDEAVAVAPEGTKRGVTVPPHTKTTRIGQRLLHDECA